jgi:DNA repair protein RadC
MERKMNQQTLTQVTEVELIYKTKVKPSDRPRITTSVDCYKIFLEHWDKNKIEFVEQFKVMLLNRANKVLGIYESSTGSVSGCVVDPKQIFCAAIKSHASSIVLVHNHPSGNLTPSEADKSITRKLKAAGEFLDLKVLDHIIVSTEGFYSFADEGLL